MASVDDIRALLGEQTATLNARQDAFEARVRTLLGEQTATLNASQEDIEARVHTRFDMLEERIDLRFEGLNERIVVLGAKLERIDNGLLKLLARVDHQILVARLGEPRDGRFLFDDSNGVLFVLERLFLQSGGAVPLTAEWAKLIYSAFIGHRDIHVGLVHTILQACSRKLDEQGIDPGQIRVASDLVSTLFEQTFGLLETTKAIPDTERYILLAVLRRCPYSAIREINMKRAEVAKGVAAKRNAETSVKTNPKRQDMEEDEETGLKTQ